MESQEIQKTDQHERLPKCTSVEKAERVNEVIDMMGRLTGNKEIEKFLMEKYGLTRSSTEPYLREARELLIQSIPKAEEIIAKHIKTYTRIAQRNEETDVRSSMIAMVNLEKLLKLHNPEVQVNNNTLNLNVEGVDNETLIESIRKLKNGEE